MLFHIIGEVDKIWCRSIKSRLSGLRGFLRQEETPSDWPSGSIGQGLTHQKILPSDNWQWWLSRLFQSWKEGHEFMTRSPDPYSATQIHILTAAWDMSFKGNLIWDNLKSCRKLLHDETDCVHPPSFLSSVLSSILIGWSYIKALNRNPTIDRQSLGGKLLVWNILFMWKWNLGTIHKSLCQHNIYKGSGKKLRSQFPLSINSWVQWFLNLPFYYIVRYVENSVYGQNLRKSNINHLS